MKTNISLLKRTEIPEIQGRLLRWSHLYRFPKGFFSFLLFATLVSLTTNSSYAQLFHSNNRSSQQNVPQTRQTQSAAKEQNRFGLKNRSNNQGKNYPQQLRQNTQQPRQNTQTTRHTPFYHQNTQNRQNQQAANPYQKVPYNRNAMAGQNYHASQQPAARRLNSGPMVSSSSSQQTLGNSQNNISVLNKGISTRESAQEIIQKIPWNAIAREDQTRLRALLSNYTFYRRLPMSGGYCNPEMFDFLICNPTTVVGLWQAMGYVQVSMQETEPYQYVLQEAAGTRGNARVLYHDDEMLLAYCYGTYKGTVIPKPLDGEALLILQIRYMQDQNAQPMVICRMDTFINIKNAGADLMGKVLAPVIGKVADSNFGQTLSFVNSISRTAEEDPAQLLASITKMNSVDPIIRNEFARVTEQVSEQAAARQRGEQIPYVLQPKLNKQEISLARIISKSGAPVNTMPANQPMNNAMSDTVVSQPAPIRQETSPYQDSSWMEMSASSIKNIHPIKDRPEFGLNNDTPEFSLNNDLTTENTTLLSTEQDQEVNIPLNAMKEEPFPENTGSFVSSSKISASENTTFLTTEMFEPDTDNLTEETTESPAPLSILSSEEEQDSEDFSSLLPVPDTSRKSVRKPQRIPSVLPSALPTTANQEKAIKIQELETVNNTDFDSAPLLILPSDDSFSIDTETETVKSSDSSDANWAALDTGTDAKTIKPQNQKQAQKPMALNSGWQPATTPSSESTPAVVAMNTVSQAKETNMTGNSQKTSEQPQKTVIFRSPDLN